MDYKTVRKEKSYIKCCETRLRRARWIWYRCFYYVVDILWLETKYERNWWRE